MGDNGKFEFTATLAPEQAADYLSKVADGLRRGVIGLAAAGRSIRLEPSSLLTLEIEAESKPEKSKGSLAVEVSWKAREQASVDNLEVTVDPREEAGHAPSNRREEAGHAPSNRREEAGHAPSKGKSRD